MQVAVNRLQRNILCGLVFIMLATNFLLTLKLFTQAQMVILVPTIDRELRVGSNFVSQEYLRLRAEQIVNLLFSMRAENQVNQELLKQIDNSNYEEFKVQLEKLTEDIKSRGYYHVFTDIQEWNIDEVNLTVQVTGYLETYLGGRQIDKQLKSYKLDFSNKGGVVNLTSFEEIKLEEQK